MAKSELELVDWLTEHCKADPTRVPIGIGDDMAALRCGGGECFVTSDMLLDGVHFDTGAHSLDRIGQKAVACSLSDCAAMAVRPVAATVSAALNSAMSMDDAKLLHAGIKRIADAFNCPVVGGDTTSWNKPLAIDVAMVAERYENIVPVRRSGAKAGDVLIVSGLLGGSRLGRHLDFTPRVEESRKLAGTLGDALHAMMDISDGLSLDLHRLCRASGCGAELDEQRLLAVIHSDAESMSQSDGVPAIEHALNDGEDFELLCAIDASAADRAAELGWHLIGVVAGSDVKMVDVQGRKHAIQPKGYEHFK